jgi:cell division protein FtsN
MQGEDAEKLRASLALLGYETRVQAVSITQGQTRYRVYLGPFASEPLALEAQMHLKTNIPDALILKNH